MTTLEEAKFLVPLTPKDALSNLDSPDHASLALRRYLLESTETPKVALGAMIRAVQTAYDLAQAQVQAQGISRPELYNHYEGLLGVPYCHADGPTGQLLPFMATVNCPACIKAWGAVKPAGPLKTGKVGQAVIMRGFKGVKK